jgi:peptidoglycan/xylan/chitin deacetylase (PgdA/CDA1 family)
MYWNIKRYNYIILLSFILVTALINIASASVEEPPVVIITVDVETTKYKDDSLPLPEQVNAICINNIPCGLQKMVGILKKKDYSATFFLNVYEYKKYGEKPIMEIAKWLVQSGHDVQLHTHPHWAYDKNRNLMHQYTLDEQIRIIREGKELLEKWTGKPVIAHRAGAYGADRNTLEALIKNNILYDSSLFVVSPNSKIAALDLKKNVLSMYGTLYEFPVTVFQKKEYPPFAEDKIHPVTRIRKYDVNWLADEIEAEKAVREAINMKMDFIILFLHSFSFIKDYSKNGNKVVNLKAIQKFEKLLKIIEAEKLKVLTFQDIKKNNIRLNHYLNKPDIIPEINVQIATIQYLRKLIGINRENYKFFILTFSVIIILTTVLMLISQKRKN